MWGGLASVLAVVIASHSISHRGWYGFGTGLVHPETTIITNGYGVWYTGTPWRPYEGVPHPKPLSAAFVAPVGGPPLIELFREVPNRPEPFRTFNCFCGVRWKQIQTYRDLSEAIRTYPGNGIFLPPPLRPSTAFGNHFWSISGPFFTLFLGAPLIINHFPNKLVHRTKPDQARQYLPGLSPINSPSIYQLVPPCDGCDACDVSM